MGSVLNREWPDNIAPDKQAACSGCGGIMYGIFDPAVRLKCHDCGGNESIWANGKKRQQEVVDAIRRNREYEEMRGGWEAIVRTKAKEKIKQRK